jgi:hypothetical protein
MYASAILIADSDGNHKAFVASRPMIMWLPVYEPARDGTGGLSTVVTICTTYCQMSLHNMYESND